MESGRATLPPYAGVSRIRFDGSQARQPTSQPRLGRGPPGNEAPISQSGALRKRLRSTIVHIIEIFLPLRDNDGRPFPAALFVGVRETLVERFGGLTAFTRSPAEGVWEGKGGDRSRDEIIIFEVMSDGIDRNWWQRYRLELEQLFRQDEIVVRGHEIERL